MPHGSRTADGNIAPLRFVKQSTTVQGRVLQCGAGDQVYGISGRHTRYPPYATLDDGFHAAQGDPCMVWVAPDTEIPLQVGGPVTQGDRLKSDVNGKGVTTTTPQDEVGAIALQNGIADQIITVQIVATQRL